MAWINVSQRWTDRIILLRITLTKLQKLDIEYGDDLPATAVDIVNYAKNRELVPDTAVPVAIDYSVYFHCMEVTCFDLVFAEVEDDVEIPIRHLG